jgi:hypothetical protein
MSRHPIHYLVTQNKNNASVLSIKRRLGVRYRTTWRLRHKLPRAMAERQLPRCLAGEVVVDAADRGWVRAGKRSRGSENRVPFVAAVELNADSRPQHLRLDAIHDLKAVSVRAS